MNDKHIFPDCSLLQPEYVKTQAVRSTTTQVFSGHIEVSKVANGFTVQISAGKNYTTETHIAETVDDVNRIIAAQIVAFRLETK